MFDKRANKIVAIKKMKLEMANEGIPKHCLREISILKEFQHKNILKLEKVIQQNNILFLVFEYLDLDLEKFISDNLENNRQADKRLVKKIIKEILEGIYAMHSNYLIHRDLKPANILLSAKFETKIADFGLSRKVDVLTQKAYTKEVVSLYYRAPEALTEQMYSFPLDIWSIGCIFYELCMNRPCFYGDCQTD